MEKKKPSTKINCHFFSLLYHTFLSNIQIAQPSGTISNGREMTRASQRHVFLSSFSSTDEFLGGRRWPQALMRILLPPTANPHPKLPSHP